MLALQSAYVAACPGNMAASSALLHPHCAITPAAARRVWRDRASASAWQQTLVAVGGANGQQHHASGEGEEFELLQPTSDPLVLCCLEALEEAEGGGADGSTVSNSSSIGGGLALAATRAWRRLLGETEAAGEVRWLPTGCVQLLDTLYQVRQG